MRRGMFVFKGHSKENKSRGKFTFLSLMCEFVYVCVRSLFQRGRKEI